MVAMLLHAGDLPQSVVDQLDRCLFLLLRFSKGEAAPTGFPKVVSCSLVRLHDRGTRPDRIRCCTVFVDVFGNTEPPTGNHIIFLHQFGTIGESDRQFVIL